MRDKLITLGDATLGGWRRTAVRPFADAVAKRTTLTPAQVRAILGFALLALSAYSVFKRTRRVAQEV